MAKRKVENATQVLRQLEHFPMTVRELAGELGCSPSTVRPWVNHLRDAGYIYELERLDSGAVSWTLTDKGERIVRGPRS